jgi:Tfp pilus assembly protein PilF
MTAKYFLNTNQMKQGLKPLKSPQYKLQKSQNPPQEIINQLFNLYHKGAIDAVNEQSEILKKQYPTSFIVWNFLGVVHKKAGRLEEATKAFKKAIKLNPNYPDSYNNLGVNLKDQGRLEEAIDAYKKALSIKPDYAEAYLNIGSALKDEGKLEEAIDAYKRALSIKPDYVSANYNMGNTLSIQGNSKEAIDAYKKALSIKPDYAKAHRSLSTLLTYHADHPQIKVVKDLMKRLDLNDADRCHLHYAFAKMKEDLGDFNAAFENYISGGLLRKKILAYDQDQDDKLFKNIRKTALKLKEFSLKKSIKGLSHTPIFVLGMPRSGTTLVEQIISCHSSVHGAGELRFLERYGGALSRGEQTLSLESMQKARSSYLSDLAKLSGEKLFVTDKMPQNFLYIGLIVSAIPEAKIIHVKRDPAATCWSNFKQYFADNGLGYSYEIGDTVNYYKLYRDLMEYWNKLFGDHIYNLNYDKLTQDAENETKKLINYLGIEWDEACLHPERHRRAVITASQFQVRRKIYTGSSKDWKKYEDFLDGAFDQFND